MQDVLVEAYLQGIKNLDFGLSGHKDKFGASVPPLECLLSARDWIHRTAHTRALTSAE